MSFYHFTITTDVTNTMLQPVHKHQTDNVLITRNTKATLLMHLLADLARFWIA